MAKFHGKSGSAKPLRQHLVCMSDVIMEHIYYGDVVRNRRTLAEGENLNKDLSVGNSISIVADAYASEHFFAIRYVEWAGELLDCD